MRVALVWRPIGLCSVAGVEAYGLCACCLGVTLQVSADATLAALAARDRMRSSVARAAPDTRLAARVEHVSVTIASAPTSSPTRGLVSGHPFLALNLKDFVTNVDSDRGSLCGRVGASFFDAGSKMAWEPMVEPFVFALQMASSAYTPAFRPLPSPSLSLASTSSHT
jgi:hypothetical protein